MRARDKLAEIINEYMEVDIPESVPDKHIPTGADYGLADEIIEAGWRPPMQKISTIEELESLPVWTELLDADYGLIQKVDSPYGTFIRPGSMAYWSAHDIVNCGPFLVQWEPECES